MIHEVSVYGQIRRQGHRKSCYKHDLRVYSLIHLPRFGDFLIHRQAAQRQPDSPRDLRPFIHHEIGFPCLRLPGKCGRRTFSAVMNNLVRGYAPVFSNNRIVKELLAFLAGLAQGSAPGANIILMSSIRKGIHHKEKPK